MLLRNKEIINLKRFEHDLDNRFSKNNQIEITSPLVDDLRVPVKSNNRESLLTELIKVAKMFPHQKCALTYKINESSTVVVEVHPVTDSA